jgi:hypothetical protein
VVMQRQWADTHETRAQAELRPSNFARTMRRHRLGGTDSQVAASAALSAQHACARWGLDASARVRGVAGRTCLKPRA